jgi:hypothetical protein
MPLWSMIFGNCDLALLVLRENQGTFKWHRYRRFVLYPRDYEVNDAGCRFPPEERLVGLRLHG